MAMTFVGKQQQLEKTGFKLLTFSDEGGRVLGKMQNEGEKQRKMMIMNNHHMNPSERA